MKLRTLPIFSFFNSHILLKKILKFSTVQHDQTLVSIEKETGVAKAKHEERQIQSVFILFFMKKFRLTYLED